MTIAVAPNASFDTLVPDCCNFGVIVRTLVAVNGVSFAGFVLLASRWNGGIVEFAANFTLIQISCLLSLLCLCLVRRWIYRTPHWMQRLACALVPASATGFIGYLNWMAGNPAFATNVSNFAPLKAAMVAGLFGACLQHYFELRVRAFSPALGEAKLQALQARIRPHFLFNSLNAVLSLIRSEPRRAEAALEDLAELFRVLMRDARDMTTLAEEIRLCKQYLSIEQIRLGERLQMRWDTVDISEEVMRRAQIPSLLLQPLLENAVHYGVEPAREPALIQIEISRVFDRIEFAVINPVSGGEVRREGNHIALNNIRQRLALLYDVEAQLTTTAARGFFEVRLRIPYVKVAK